MQSNRASAPNASSPPITTRVGTLELAPPTADRNRSASAASGSRQSHDDSVPARTWTVVPPSPAPTSRTLPLMYRFNRERKYAFQLTASAALSSSLPEYE